MALALLPHGDERRVGVSALRQEDLVNLEHLLQGMRQRLELMHDVARWKWNTGRPIADTERERALLESVVERGRGIGLDPHRVRAFFAAQIEAARLIQQTDFESWSAQKQGRFPEITSLTVLRERIDALNLELLDALAKLSSQFGRRQMQQALAQRAQAILNEDGLAAARATAIGPLRR